MADDTNIDEEGLRRSARSQIIVDTIERSLEKMMFVEANMTGSMDSKDLFQVKREAVAAVAEPTMALTMRFSPQTGLPPLESGSGGPR